MSRRFIATLAATGLLALTLAACAGGGEPSTAGGPGTGQQAAVQDATTPRPKAKGTAQAAPGKGATGPSRAGAAAGKPGGTDLADGRHPTYIKAIDPARGTVTVDVVQVLRDKAAQDAARAAGEEYPETYAVWIANDSGRLRELPVAPGVRIDGLIEYKTCESASKELTVQHKLAWLQDKLERNPRYATSPYVFWMTLSKGEVNHIYLEKLFLQPAC